MRRRRSRRLRSRGWGSKRVLSVANGKPPGERSPGGFVLRLGRGVRGRGGNITPPPRRSSERCISAHAEETGRTRVWVRLSGVYLRTRGGNAPIAIIDPAYGGLSPHTRRKLQSSDPVPRSSGSISAHAEETANPILIPSTTRVYLRTRGGNFFGGPLQLTDHGLSPHTRRKQSRRGHGSGHPRSISAHAEETGRTDRAAADAGVYLRTRGGNARIAHSSSWIMGLSPHTRRKLVLYACDSPRNGSISAHAEETTACRSRCHGRTVYLRTRGGN